MISCLLQHVLFKRQYACVADYPVYHSMYDDFFWMRKFGDPLFHRHVAVASICGLVALRLADDEFLSFNYVSYAYELQMSTNELEHMVLGIPISFTPLYRSIEELSKAAEGINYQKKALEASKRQRNLLKVTDLNDRLMMAERAFTSPEGLFERPWYKHLIYAPSKRNTYGSNSFPGIYDAIESYRRLNTTESWHFVQHEIWRAARAVLQASLVLNGKFS
uniref:Putative glutamate carboxypeptidase 2 n=2 Tax=Anthurium amnicola TaxID=1678845 RepID=A0A1D1Z5S5_9ARAE